LEENEMTKSRRPLGAWIALVALTAMIGACGNNGDRSGMYGDNAKNGSREGATVEMTSSHQFSPREVTVKVGESVLWKNASNDVHTVTADPSRAKMKENVSLPAGAKPFHSGEIQAGKSYRQTFTTAGTYKYACLTHEDQGMTGTVIVKPADTGSPNPY
jgi:plastocyanin